MKRIAFSLAFVTIGVVACSEGAIVVGDDTEATPDKTTTDTTPTDPDPLIDPDAAPFEASTDDAPPITVGPPDGGKDAANDVSCPTLSPPAPGFCDGASPVPLYDANACIVGYGCALVPCATAGGQCVGLAPTSCPAPKKWGDATKYTCGGGIGSGCCLP